MLSPERHLAVVFIQQSFSWRQRLDWNARILCFRYHLWFGRDETGEAERVGDAEVWIWIETQRSLHLCCIYCKCYTLSNESENKISLCEYGTYFVNTLRYNKKIRRRRGRREEWNFPPLNSHPIVSHMHRMWRMDLGPLGIPQLSPQPGTTSLAEGPEERSTTLFMRFRLLFQVFFFYSVEKLSC